MVTVVLVGAPAVTKDPLIPVAPLMFVKISISGEFGMLCGAVVVNVTSPVALLYEHPLAAIVYVCTPSVAIPAVVLNGALPALHAPLKSCAATM
jgi:hypothetical protein